MDYISGFKKFELFSENNEYYTKITEFECNDFYTHIDKHVNFNYTDELNKYIESQPGYRPVDNDVTRMPTNDAERLFRSMFKERKPTNSCCIGDICINKRGLQKRNGILNYIIESDKWYCAIFEAQDEWFFVILDHQQLKFRRYYYKCDQFEGLLKLLKDKKVI